MKHVLLIFSLFILGATISAQNWNDLNVQVTNDLSSIQFLSDEIGYSCGSGGIILKTTNHGTNWSKQVSGTTNTLYSLYFTDSNKGFACGYVGTMLATTNGGTTWNKQTTGTTEHLISVYFVNSLTGYSVGYNGTILKTTNGGSTWTPMVSNTTENLYSVRFVDANTGFVIGDKTILKTTNGGTTWTKTATTYNLRSLHFTSSLKGFAGGSSGTILATTDGGTTWTPMAIAAATTAFYALNFKDANNGYAAGLTSIYKTIDGGLSWTAQTSNSPENLSSIAFTTNNWYMVGAKATFLQYNGSIWAASKINTNLNISISSISFPESPTIGYVAGDAGISKTLNGGDSWTSIAAGKKFYSCFFTDNNTGTAVGENGAIYSTINGGASWRTPSTGNTNSFLSVYLTSTTTGYIVGTGGIILKTTDGFITATYPDSKTSEDLYKVFFVDANTGFIGGNKTILKTTDGGDTWTRKTITENVRSLYFATPLVGYAGVGNGRFLKTTDGGDTWTTRTAITSTNAINTMFFTSKDTGYLACDGYILKTVNGGQNWDYQLSSRESGCDLRAICFTNSLTGYAAGTAGKIFKTTNGGGPVCIIAPGRYTVPGAGRKDTLYLMTDLSWTVKSEDPWITFDKTSGVGSSNIVFICSENPNTAERIGTVYFYSGANQIEYIFVDQLGKPSLSVSPNTFDIAAVVSVPTLAVTSANVTWTATSNQTWLVPNKTSGTGNFTLQLYANANPTTSPRSAQVTISGPGVTSQVITVNQAGAAPSISVSASSFTVGCSTSTQTFTVSSTTSWTITSSEGWLSTDITSGTGNSATITLSAQGNVSGSRTATLTIAATGVTPKTISVTQNGVATLAVNSNNLTLAAAANSSQTLNITSNGSWTVQSDQTWLVPSKTTGTLNSAVTLIAQANSSTSTRTATVTVQEACGRYETITVVQDGMSFTPTLTISSNSLTINSPSSTQTFNITSNTSWTITSNQAWLSADKTSGINNATIILTAQNNSLTAPRTATITISATGVTPKTITVTQSGNPTAISDITNGKIQIYPNPAKDRVTIDLKGQSDIQSTTIGIYNLQGKLLWKQPVTSEKTEVYLSKFAKGTLIIEISDNTGVVVSKIVSE